MSGECEKCGEHCLDCNCPTEITFQDIDTFFEKLKNGEYDPKMRRCFKCNKEFWPNYDIDKCDECYFSQFPKEQVKAFYRSFFE